MKFLIELFQHFFLFSGELLQRMIQTMLDISHCLKSPGFMSCVYSHRRVNVNVQNDARMVNKHCSCPESLVTCLITLTHKLFFSSF